MGFLAAIRTCFRKYFTISGRAPRSEYWYFVLFLLLAGIVAAVLDSIVFGSETLDSDSGGPIAIIFNLATLIPSITAGVRRLHDTNKPGYYLFFPFLVVIGGAVVGGVFADNLGLLAGALFVLIIVLGLLVYLWWFIKPSDPGPNNYGPNPLHGHDRVEEIFE